MLQTTIYHLKTKLANLQKMDFMLDIVTKSGKCYHKMGSFLFYKTRQVLLQSKVGITEWHNFYYKIRGGVFQSGTIIKKNKKIEQKDSDNSVLEPQSLKVKLLKLQKVAWRCDIKLMNIVHSNRVFFKKTQSIQNS